MKKVIQFILILIVFASCRKEANIKLPVTKSLPVIYSFICPEDSLIRVKVTASQPLYQNTGTDIYVSVNNAQVVISGEQGNKEFIYNANTEYYELKSAVYSLIPGKVYKLKVTTASGDVAMAETQIPLELIPIDKVTYETILEQQTEIKNIKLSFTDPVSSKNFYNLSFATVQVGQFLDTLYNETGIRTLHDDVNKNGEYTTLSGRYYTFIEDTVSILDAYLLNCTAAYYKYHLSLQNYSGDNPFSEPSLIYSNVTGGYGVFASFRKSKKRIVL